MEYEESTDSNIDFHTGEQPRESQVYTVSEITYRIRSTLEKRIGAVWVEGEISNLTYHTSGHVYFTLKDGQSQLSAVMFRGDAVRLKFRLKDGMLIQGFGRITVYAKRGHYQIVLETIQLAGQGNLQAAFEALKKKLQDEGLFDPDRKRPLPAFPLTVGVVTSPQGAAIRDFCRVLHRRFAGIRIIIAPTAVQGDGAAQGIASAVDLLNLMAVTGPEVQVDVIAIIRGGGSLEDLWAFNEEVVARAVARSQIPTLTGIGHEVDFTICDFVADLRAPTPSAAAEMLIRTREDFLSDLQKLSRNLQQSTRLNLGESRRRLWEAREGLRSREPRQVLREWRQRLDEAASHLERTAIQILQEFRKQWMTAVQNYQRFSPERIIENRYQSLRELKHQMELLLREQTGALKNRLELQHQRLELLSPLGTLQRGYSITLSSDHGRVIRHEKEVKPGDTLITRLSDGSLLSRVLENPERNHENSKPGQ